MNEPMRVTSPTLHATIWFTMSVFVALIVMACVFKVEVVARGQGKVVPVSRVQVVQPEFDGKVTAIHVRNGDAVEKGDVLIELDTTDADAELNTVNAEIFRLEIERSRIMAIESELGNNNVNHNDFGESALVRFQARTDTTDVFAIEQGQLLVAEIDDLQSALRQTNARKTANEHSISVTQTNIERVELALKIQKERLDVSKDLLDRGTSSRFKFLEVQETFTSLEKERDVYLKELDQKHSQGMALDAEYRSLLTNQRRQALSRRAEIDARLASLLEQVQTSKRRKAGASLLAPMDGVIDQLETFTIGAIASGGDQLLRVVPKNQEIEVDAFFSNNDIGFVKVGQITNISIDAYPSERFGFLKGKVRDIAADSLELGDGNWAYSVRVSPDTNNLKNGEVRYQIRPGMTTRIDIVTENRRIISYFFAPIIDTLQSAISEK